MSTEMESRRLAWKLGVFCLATCGLVFAETPLRGGANVSHAEFAQAPRQVVMDELPQFTATAGTGHHFSPMLGIPIAKYQAMKADAERVALESSPMSLGSPESTTRGAEGSSSIETPGAFNNFTGAAGEVACGSWIPGDQALAVSEGYLMQAVNDCVVVYNKNTHAVLAGYPKSIQTFLGLGSSAFLSDPRLTYDWSNHRFVFTELEFDSNFGTTWVAVSKTNNPTGGWYVYGLPYPGTGIVGDFPHQGSDRLGIYVGMNRFNNSTGAFIDEEMLVLPKVSMYAGSLPSYFIFSGFYVTNGTVTTYVDTMQPADVPSHVDFPRAAFFVNSWNINGEFGNACTTTTPCNGLSVWAISNPLGAGGRTPELSYASTSTRFNYSFPPNARQPACTSGTCLINTGDNRISGEVFYSSGSIFGSFETQGTPAGGDGQAHPIWFQLRPFLNDGNSACTGTAAGRCADISGVVEENEDCYFCGGFNTNGSAYYAVVVPDTERNATMVFSLSDDNVYPGLAYASRRVTQAQNTMHDAGIYLQGGQAFYQQLDQFSRNRWGDYNAAAPDLFVTTSFPLWFSGQFADSSGNWETKIGTNQFTGVTQP